MIIAQLREIVDVAEKGLTIEHVTMAGVLIVVIAFMIYDKLRQEKIYKTLLLEYIKEQKENKEVLIDLVTKTILTNEQTTQALNTIRDVYKR